MSQNKYPRVLTKGTESELKTTPVVDGKLRFTTDTGKVFLDTENTRRQITDLELKYTENQIKAITDPLDKIYVSSDTHRLFIYSNGWVVCGESNTDVVDKALEADHANSANNTINASTADYANNSGNASTAEYANNADVSKSAMNDINGNAIHTTYAPLESPSLTGTPTVPTAQTDNDSDQVANTSFVNAAIKKAIGQIIQFDPQIVLSLPEEGSKGVLYLMLNAQPETDNVYDEYLWIDDKFEKIGSVKIDLSEYYSSYNISGNGNAITDVNTIDGTIHFHKDTTFLTEHPSVSLDSSTYSETPSGGSTIEVIDSIALDNYGHLAYYRKKTVEIPNSVSNAGTAIYAETAGTATYAEYAKSIGNATIVLSEREW